MSEEQKIQQMTDKMMEYMADPSNTPERLAELYKDLITDGHPELYKEPIIDVSKN